MVGNQTLTSFNARYFFSDSTALSRHRRQFGGQCFALEKRTSVRKRCIFPFKYQGRIYNGCITKNDPELVCNILPICFLVPEALTSHPNATNSWKLLLGTPWSVLLYHNWDQSD